MYSHCWATVTTIHFHNSSHLVKLKLCPLNCNSPFYFGFTFYPYVGRSRKLRVWYCFKCRKISPTATIWFQNTFSQKQSHFTTRNKKTQSLVGGRCLKATDASSSLLAALENKIKSNLKTNI